MTPFDSADDRDEEAVVRRQPVDRTIGARPEHTHDQPPGEEARQVGVPGRDLLEPDLVDECQQLLAAVPPVVTDPLVELAVQRSRRPAPTAPACRRARAPRRCR